VLVATSITVPSVAATTAGPNGQGANLPSAAATNRLATVTGAPTLPLKFVEGASGSNVDVRPNITVSPAPKVKTEVASLRTEKSRTYANPNGTFNLQVSSGRINYLDATGAWQPIDTTLVAAAAGSKFDLVEKANDKRVSISKTHPDTGLAELSVGPYTLGIRIPSIGTFTAASTTTSTTFTSAAGSYGVTATPEGLEISATLADATAPSAYSFALDTGGLVATIDADKLSIDLTDPKAADPTAVVGQIGVPTLRDATEMVAPPSAITVGLNSTDKDLKSGETLVTYALDQAWLTDAARAYPVVLDPSVCIRYGNSDCAYHAASDVVDTFVMSGIDTYPVGWGYDRVGTSNQGDGYGEMRTLLWFTFAPLPDGAHVTSATLKLREIYNGGPAGQQVDVGMNTSGFTATSHWSNKPATATSPTSPTASFNACSAPCNLVVNVNSIAHAWYTRRKDDWMANLGFTLALHTASNAEMRFENETTPTYDRRPNLNINYDIGAYTMSFDPALGPDFAPSAVLADSTVNLPVSFKNTSTLAWDTSWSIGYRWYDSKGNALATPAQGKKPLTASVAAGDETGIIQVPITTPPQGQYTLRMDMVRTVNGADLWLSDWSEPTLYMSHTKASSSSSNVHIAGKSVVEREEYPISALAPSGGGESKSASLPDGSSLSINLWSKVLGYSGTGGVGFSDLGTSIGLGYGYNSGDLAAYTGVIGAPGWFTNYDERIEPGLGNAAYTYRSSSGSPSSISVTKEGALTGGVGGRLDRPRISVFDENLVAGSDTSYAWTGTPPTYTTPAGGAYSGTHVYQIAASNTTGTTAPLSAGPVKLGALPGWNPTPISINTYARLSFALKTESDSGAALALYVTDGTTGVSKWFAYTVGTDWTLPTGWVKKNIAASPTGSWSSASSTTSLDLLDDVAVAMGVSANHSLTVSSIEFLGRGGAGNVYYDDIRFEGAFGSLFDEYMPIWTSGSSTPNTTDVDPTYPDGSLSMQVAAGSYSASPYCYLCQIDADGGHLLSWSVNSLPYAAWSWKKVGGNTIAVAFALHDSRSGWDGTITYYAGPTPPAGAPNPVQVSPSVPVSWTPVVRNLLEDGRQVLGFYNDADTTGTSNSPNLPPTPDPVSLSGFRLIAGDGSYGLFDTGGVATMPNVAKAQLGHTTGDDFVITYAGGASHRFNADGMLTSMVDANANKTSLIYTYDALSGWTANSWAGQRYTLTTIIAPSDGMTIPGGGTAVRRINVTRPGSCGLSTADSCVRFTEALGSGSDTGRYTEFDLVGGDLKGVVPARLSAPCAASGASGCLGFAYGGSHLLNRVDDPRYPGAAGDYTTVTWTGGEPRAVVDHSGASPTTKLSVASFDTGTGSGYLRPAWQDADNAVAGTVRMEDVSPNGNAKTEYAPIACGSNCAAATPADKLVVYQTDGRPAWQDKAGAVTDPFRRSDLPRYGDSPISYVDLSASVGNFSAEIRFRTAQSGASQCTIDLVALIEGDATQTCGSPVVTRGGSYASFGVDNYSDPIIAGETAWTQDANAFAASVASGSPDRYRTFYVYNAYGQTTDTIVPFSTQVSTYKRQILDTPGIAHYWRLDETSGSALDSVTSGGAAGTPYGALTRSQPTSLVADPDYSIKFDGSTACFKASPASAMTGTFTVEALVKPDDATATMSIVGTRDTGYGFDMKLMKGNLLHADIGNGSVWLTATADAAFNYRAGQWYDIVYVVTPTGYSIYVNGAAIGAGTYSTSGTPILVNSTHHLFIGQAGNGTEWFKGTIDEVSLYTGALTARQVAAHYAASGAVALQDQQIVYDVHGNPLQALDNFLVNPGFESSLDSWTTSGATISSTHAPAPSTSLASALLAQNGYVSQIVGLVPGQTTRLQLALKETGTGAGRITFTPEVTPGVWSSTPDVVNDTAGDWHLAAWDYKLPIDSTGRLKVTISNAGGTSSGVYVDDVALFSTYRSSAYDDSHGLVTTVTEVSGASGANATTVSNYDYGAADTYATNLLANGGFASGTGSWTLDQGGTSASFSVLTADASHTLRDGETTGFALSGANYGSTGQVNVTGGSGTLALWQRVAATPGHTYSLSGLVARSSLTCVHLRLNFQDSGGSTLAVTDAPCTAKSGGPDRADWSYQTLSGVAPANAAYVVAKVQAETSGTGSLWADQLRLIDGATPSPYVADNSVTPAVFPTRVTSNVVNGGTAPDQNVASITAYDRWGRAIVTIDPDGVGPTTQYAPNQTDVATTSDGLGNVSRTTSWDAVGNALSTTDPAGYVTSTTYNFANSPVDVTPPDGKITHTSYNDAGRPLHAWSNYVGDGSDHSVADRNLETSLTYDAGGNGWVVAKVSDDGGIAATSQTTYDLQGATVSTTAHTGAGGTGQARATTSHFDRAGNATGTQAAITPTGTDAPFCPDSSSQRCNSVSYLDLSGRAVESIDAYGIKTHSWYDIAGHAVRTISNYKPGLAYTAVQNIVTDTRYDIGGRPLAVTSYLLSPTDSFTSLSSVASGNVYVANTSYDALGRSLSIVKPDSSWTHTVYTKGGRVDRASRPGASGQTDSDVAWTANRYDAAGRQTTTVSDYDITGAAGIAIEGFEGDSAGWDAGGGAWFLRGGIASASLDTTTVHTGQGSLLVSASGANQGAEWTLPGTFTTHHYKARAWVYAPAGATIRTYLSVDSNCTLCSTDTSWSAAGWQKIDVDWTPGTAPAANAVKLAVVNTGTGAVTFRVDDVSVWDTVARNTTTKPNPANVPSSVTVFDARGKVIESVGAPAQAGDSAPVTASAYDNMGRLTSVTVNTVTGAGHGANDTNLDTHYAYDDLGRQVETTDPAGNKTHLGYDRLGNLVSGILDYGDSSHLNLTGLAGYNALGELIATCSPVQVAAACVASGSDTRSWRYAYDAMGHQTTATPPVNAVSPLATTTSAYELGGAGRPYTVTASTRTTTYGYDLLGRQNSVGVTNTGFSAISTSIALDSLGRQTAISGNGDVLAQTYDAVGRLTSISRSGIAITTFTYNADGTAATRTDRDAAGTNHVNSFTYTNIGQLAQATLPDSLGTAAYTWALDGNMASRTWGSTAIAGTYAYDGAKRPISLTITRTGQAQNDVLARTYDLVGNVTSETQTLQRSGGTGTNPTLAYGQTESFTYDHANRVTASSFGGSLPEARTYTYDADGNRKSVTEAGVTFYYFYDATDALVTKNTTNVAPNPATPCATLGFCYDAWGDLTASSPSTPDSSALRPTTYTVDAAGRMLSIDDGNSAHRVSFVLDALGRHASQTIGVDPNAVTTTYAYLGTSNTVSSMSVGTSVTTTSLIDAIGNRLGQGTPSAFGGYLIADLHGNIVAAVSAGGSPTLLSAYRYDAYGETCGSWTADSGSLSVPWRFGGRLLESISGTTTDLYDFGARSYDPSLGAFTSFDSVSGSAGNPLTLNRYLYANANPATLVDPDGHAAWQNSCHYDAEDCAGILKYNARQRANARIAGPGHVCADNSHWCGNAPPVVSTCLSTNTCNVDIINTEHVAKTNDPGGAHGGEGGWGDGPAIAEAGPHPVEDCVENPNQLFCNGHGLDLDWLADVLGGLGEVAGTANDIWQHTGGPIANNFMYPPGVTSGWCSGASAGAVASVAFRLCTVRAMDGTWAHIANYNFGGELGATASVGVSWFVSDAATIDDLAGWFYSTGISGGEGLVFGGDLAQGHSSNGQDVKVWSFMVGGGAGTPVSGTGRAEYSLIIDTWR
jgi:RHS repeat-associated protein